MNRRPWLAGALLAALVGVAYAPTWRAGFIWDDDRYVTANPALQNAQGLAAIWTRLDATPQFYPVTHTSFWIQHALWALDPRGYHAVSVLFHAGSAILLWRILLLLQVPGAWLAAAVFGVHPVHVESVAWITEQKNTLSGIFYFAAALVFLRGAGLRPAGRLHPIAAAAIYLAALLSKTVTSTLPVALGIVLWWKNGRVENRQLARLAPMLTLGGVLAAITRQLERTQVGASGPDWALTIPERVALAGRIAWFYLGKLAWPANLTFIYPRFNSDAVSIQAWLYTLAFVTLAASAWLLRNRLGRGPFAAVSFFAVTLSPALGFFDVYPMRYSFVADHFQYLASVGPIVIAIAAAAALPSRRSGKIVAGALLLVLASRTFARCHVYTDDETLWRDTLARNEGAWIAHNNLGILLAQRGENDEAALHFERAVALRPEHAGAWANLGYLQELSGKFDEAALTLARAAATRPEDADARTHLVHVLVRLNRSDDALRYALEAVTLRPGDAAVLTDAGVLLIGAGRAAEAVPLLTRALTLQPGLEQASRWLDLARRSAARPKVGYPLAPVSPSLDKETSR